jgi:hypothetical protein
VIGLGLSWAAVRLLVATGPASLPRLAEVRTDAIAPVACWLPARRAARLNPLETLRAD